jgi:hypothetical protein
MLNYLYLIEEISVGLSDSAQLTYILFTLQRALQRQGLEFKYKKYLIKVGLNNMEYIGIFKTILENEKITTNELLQVLGNIPRMSKSNKKKQ